MPRAAKSFSSSLLFVLLAMLLSMASYSVAQDVTDTVVCSGGTTADPSPASPQFLGTAVSFTAVAHDSTANNAPTGSIQFQYSNPAVSGGAPQNIGSPVVINDPQVGNIGRNRNCNETNSNSRSSARITTSALPAGTNTITATYIPDAGTWSGSTSAGITYTINAPTTTTAISTAASGPVLGQAVSFTATITPTGGNSSQTLSGNVKFVEQSTGAFLGVAALIPVPGNSANTTATFTISSLSLGAHSVDAYYLGNGTFVASDTSAGPHATIGGGGVVKRATTVNVLAPATAGVGVSTAVNVSVADNSAIPLGSRGGFTATGSLSTARSRHASSLLPAAGSALVTGGMSASSTVLSTSAIYSGGSFAAGPALDVARTGHTQTLLQDGTVVVIGGSSDGSTALDTAASYDPVAGSNFVSLGACGAPGSPRTNCLVTARMNHTATLLSNGKVLIAGGGVTSLEVYDPTAKTFTTVTGGLTNARSGATATLLSDDGTTAVILYVGGDGTTTAELYTYTLASNSGTSAFTTGNASSPRAFHTATLLPDGSVVIMGGEDGATVWNTIEFYNPSLQTFYAVAGTLAAASQGQTARLLGDGSVLIVGGASGANDPTTGSSSATLYTPPYDPIGPSVAVAITAQDSNAAPVADGATNGTCDTLTPSSTGGGTGTLSCAGTFTPAAVGTNPHVVTATFATTGTHTTNNGTANVTVQNAIVLTAATDTRTYDGTTSSSQAPIQTDVTQLQGTDAVSTLPGEFVQTFDSKNVGARTLSITTVFIRDSGGTGADHTANYVLSLQTAAGSITTAAITPDLIASNKVYDATTVEPNASMSCSFLSGVFGADDVGCAPSGNGTFDTKDVGNTHTVSATVTLTGTTAGNYTFGAAGTTVNSTSANATNVSITTKTLFVTGLTAAARVYDGTTVEPLGGTAALLTAEGPGAGSTADGKPYTGDTVSLTGTAAGAFATKDVGTAKAVTVTGLTLSGLESTNYVLDSPSQQTGLAADVTPKPLFVSGLTSNDKVYDATTAATLGGTAALLAAENVGTGTTTDGTPYNGDTVTLGGTATGTFVSKDVANGITITVTGNTLSGAQAADYQMAANEQPGLTANITPKTLTVTGLTASNKIYDATTVATFTGTAALQAAEAPGAGTTADGKPYSGDTVTLGGSATGTFASKDVANGIAVTVTGNTLSGAQSTNYALATNEQAGLTANITPKTLNVTGLTAQNKTYDTFTTATLTGTPVPLTAEAPGAGSTSDGAPYTGDTVTVGGTAVGTFASKNVGTAIAVTVTGNTLGGPEGTNYVLAANEQTGLTADIVTAPITASLVASNKTYNGDNVEPNGSMTCSFAGVLGTDVVTCTPSAGTFGGINVGTYNVSATATIGGTDGGNYTQGIAGTNTPAASVTAANVNIVTKAVTATLTAAGKPYDGTTTEPDANMSCAYTAGDIIAADAALVSCAASSGSFASASAGTHQVTATLTIGGPQGTNYTFGAVGSTQPTIQGTANATIGTLAVTASLAAGDKVYDQTVTEPNASMSCTFAAGAILAADAANVACAPSSGTFDSAAVGARTVTATMTIGGTAGANYTFGAAGTNTPATAGSAPANITALAITGNISANNKVYDSTTAATISTRTLTGVIAGDNVTYSGGTATFSDKNVGTAKTVSATGLSLTGTEAGNYTVNSTANTTANITPAPLAVTATASNKVYDGNTTATVALADNRFAGDLLTETNTTATFSDKNVGTGKTVTVSGISISGTDAGNYTANTTTTTTANITPAALTVTASNLSKVQGTLLTFAGTEFTQVGLQPGDTLVTIGLSSAGAAIAAAPGNYDILITQPFAGGNFTGTMAPSNYTITYTKGSLAVGQAPSSIKLVATFTAANNGFGGTYSFKATVASSTSGTPSGTVSFTDNGTAISGSPITLSGGTGTLSGAILTSSTAPHVIVATYNGDPNFKTSTVTIDVTSAVPPSPFNAGGTVSPTASVTFAGVATTTGTLATPDLTCAVTSAVVAVDPLLLSCTASLDKTLNPGGAGTLTINIRTVAGTVAGMRPPVNPAGGSMRSLYLLSFGMPAFVFIGLAAPLATLRQKKTLRGKLVVWLGMLLVFALLLVSVGCGGGFSNPNNLGPVTIRAAVPGTYNAVVTYKDSGNNTQVLAVMPFTIN